MPFRRGFLLLLFTLPCLLRAQEIRYIGLTDVRQRTELRYPPAPPPECKDGTCTSGGIGGGGIGDGAPDRRDPHALGIYLLRVTPTDITPAEPFQVESKALNTATAPMELPVSPIYQTCSPAMSLLPSTILASRWLCEEKLSRMDRR